jgi:transglutaminase/protease-like cytokinesis protein 3
MDMLDIECDIITGVADGESHAWNRVKIDGEYYLIDVTWNDPVTDNPSDRINYEYFNVTDEVLSISHTPTRTQTKIANSTEHNYFYYNNLVVYSKDDFLAILEEAINTGKDYVYVLCKNIDLTGLVESQEIFDYLGSHTRISYSHNERVNTLYLRFS